MKTLTGWLDEYSESHRNPMNKLLHWLCIPLIVFSFAAALKAIPVGTNSFNAATVVGVLSLLYYARLSWQLAVGMTAIFTILYAGVLALEAATGAALAGWAVGIFVIGWVGQFIGHHLEGARPSFLKDLQFLLIGPLWLLADVYQRLALPLGRGAVARD